MSNDIIKIWLEKASQRGRNVTFFAPAKFKMENVCRLPTPLLPLPDLLGTAVNIKTKTESIKSTLLSRMSLGEYSETRRKKAEEVRNTNLLNQDRVKETRKKARTKLEYYWIATLLRVYIDAVNVSSFVRRVFTIYLYSTNKFSRVSIFARFDIYIVCERERWKKHTNVVFDFFLSLSLSSFFLAFITAKHHKLKCTSYIIIIFFFAQLPSLPTPLEVQEFSVFSTVHLAACEHYYNSQWKIDCEAKTNNLPFYYELYLCVSNTLWSRILFQAHPYNSHTAQENGKRNKRRRKRYRKREAKKVEGKNRNRY